MKKLPNRILLLYYFANIEKIQVIYIGRVKIRKLHPGIRSSTCEES